MKINNICIVGGKFDENGGKPSGFIKKFSNYFPEGTIVYNGGSWKELQEIYDHLGEDVYDDTEGVYGSVLWFADVPNTHEKIIEKFKKDYPFICLVTSKRNFNKEYSLSELVGRSLKLKSNLLIEFTGERDNIKSSIYDPLGNCFLYQENNLEKIAKILINRLNKLVSFTRYSSVNISSTIIAPADNDDINTFMKYVKNHAEKFHEIIHGAQTERMLGNLSFRCQRGFPSFKYEDIIFVSRRNIDKRYIDLSNMVAVEPEISFDEIGFYGLNKPSVDTPVQLKLYEYYKNINFMLHSHTYIRGGLFTKQNVPCGAVEEFNEIINVNKNKYDYNFCINLLGHGSIAFGKNASFFENIDWYSRPIPEML